MAKRARVRLRWVPVWDGPVRNYALKFISENRWRCDRIHSLRDLEQDAFLLYLKIAEKYPRVTEAKHFMALFKTALRNKFHDHARYRRRKLLIHQDTNEDAALLDKGVDPDGYGYLGALLNEAPEELKQALILFATEPEKLRSSSSQRENLNMKLRRILGLNTQFDFSATLKLLLKQALILFATEPEKLRSSSSQRENLNMKLRRILGLNTQFDFSATLKLLLS